MSAPDDRGEHWLTGTRPPDELLGIFPDALVVDRSEISPIYAPDMKNLMWTFALLVSLVFLAFAYYMRSEAVRTAINARIPWVKKTLGPYAPETRETAKVSPRGTGSPAATSGEVPPALFAPAAPPEPEVFDLNKL